MGSIAEGPRHVFAKRTNFLARNCKLLLREQSPLAERERTRDGRERSLFRSLAFAVYDPAFCQIVGREFDPNAVAWDDADEMLAHPTCNVGHDDVSTFDLDAKTSIGEGLSDHALDFECFFLLFCHKCL